MQKIQQSTKMLFLLIFLLKTNLPESDHQLQFININLLMLVEMSVVL